MNKTLWIINEYAGSPYHGMGMRHYYLSKELLKLGLNVYIITASYSHLLYKYHKVSKNFFLDKIDGINYIWIKVNRYKNAHSVGRVLKWLFFSFRLNPLAFRYRQIKDSKTKFYNSILCRTFSYNASL